MTYQKLTSLTTTAQQPIHLEQQEQFPSEHIVHVRIMFVSLLITSIIFHLIVIPSLDIVDKVPVVLGQIAVLSCNPNVTRFFPKPIVRWYIKIMEGSTFIEEFRINPESSSKYKTIDDGRHLVIYNISENDSFSYNHTKDGVTKPIASKIYACTAGYDRLNVPNIEYYIHPRYNLEIEGKIVYYYIKSQ